MTSELLDLRVPAGMAMTGRIIESGMPLIVTRYFGDPNFVHFPDVDRVMEREKIVATVGVPLVNGSKRLGALIAANRDERAYTPADLDLLHSLAGHAAISIERSRLAEETKTALRSLEDANRELARSNAESERATTAHFTLSQVALAGGNIDNLVQEVVKIVGGELAVFDPDDRLLADVGDLSGTAQPPELIRQAALARTTQTSGSLVAIPILAAARLLGILYYQGDETPRSQTFRSSNVQQSSPPCSYSWPRQRPEPRVFVATTSSTISCLATKLPAGLSTAPRSCEWNCVSRTPFMSCEHPCSNVGSLTSQTKQRRSEAWPGKAISSSAETSRR